jgi:Family of unknown function (DUF5330)
MFFLLRATFWLGLVLLLLPNSGPKSVSSVQIGAADALSAAGAAVSDMRQFCVRQPEACIVGGQAASALSDQAQAGAKMLLELLHDRSSSNEAARSTRSPSQNTLKPTDVAPAWRGPLPRKEARQPA